MAVIHRTFDVETFRRKEEFVDTLTRPRALQQPLHGDDVRPGVKLLDLFHVTRHGLADHDVRQTVVDRAEPRRAASVEHLLELLDLRRSETAEEDLRERICVSMF